MKKLLTLVYNLALLNVWCKALDGSYETDVAGKSYTGIEMNKDCTEIWCERYSFSEVASMYSGLFMTKFQFLMQQIIFYLDRDIVLYHEGVKDFEYIVGSDGDGDSCCVTKQVTYINHTLRNVLGQWRRIVHLSNVQKYQFISQAECIEVDQCDGMCVLEDTIRTVLVYDGHSITFDQVLVPSYCSCKRTG